MSTVEVVINIQLRHAVPYPEYSALCVDVGNAKHYHCTSVVVHWGQRSDTGIDTSLN